MLSLSIKALDFLPNPAHSALCLEHFFELSGPRAKQVDESPFGIPRVGQARSDIDELLADILGLNPFVYQPAKRLCPRHQLVELRGRHEDGRPQPTRLRLTAGDL